MLCGAKPPEVLPELKFCMRPPPSSHAVPDGFDVLVAGADVGGVCAAVSAARAGCRVALLEAALEIGGTGVHSPVGLICSWFDASGRPINKGLYAEILPYLFDPDGRAREDIHTYREDELKAGYLRLLEGEPNLSVFTSCEVVKVVSQDGTIRSVRTPAIGSCLPLVPLAMAAGTAAALMARLNETHVRQIEASWIRHDLKKLGQFVEGICASAPLPV